MTRFAHARRVGLTMFAKTTITAPATEATARRPRFARDASPRATRARVNTYRRGLEAMRLDPYSPPRHRR